MRMESHAIIRQGWPQSDEMTTSSALAPGRTLLEIDDADLPIVHQALRSQAYELLRAGHHDASERLLLVWREMCATLPMGAVIFPSEAWAEIAAAARYAQGQWEVRHQLRRDTKTGRIQGPIAVRIEGRVWQTSGIYLQGSPLLKDLARAMTSAAPRRALPREQEQEVLAEPVMMRR